MFGKNGKSGGDSLDYSKIQTVIGEGTEVRGNIHSCGTMRIDGTLEGTIEHDGNLIVGPTGILRTNVVSKAMAVAGEVRGEVIVEGKLELLATARLFGQIRCSQFVVHEGAYFEGTSNLEPQPLTHGVA